MAITKESIAKAEAEQKRLKDIKNLKEKNIKQSDEVIYGLIDLLFKSRQGDISHQKFKTTFLKNHATNLSLTDSIRVFHNPVHGHECLEHMLKMISSPDSDKLLCLWTVKDTIVQQLHLVEVEEKPRTNNKHSLSVELGKRHVIHSWHKITNVCWAPFQKYPGRKNILYTTNCHHTGQALVYIRDLDVAVSDDIALFDFRVGSQATWTCAWNKQTEKFSVGAEKTCLLIDVATRRLWELNTLNSDPLAQTFSSNNLLYNGTRKGQILSHDLRSSSTRPIRCMSHKSSISHLLLSYDENSIYASDFTGQLRVWDTRKNAVVMEYRGLYNEYKRIPFHIDESNTIIYGAGQDGYTKIWCVKTGKMLLNLPPPCSVSLDTIPALQFSTRWANKPGNSGLLMGLGDKIYMYSNS
ncbi:DDB1- and CUL4-associated factor 4 [Patella vulgata]|uniref:DDB1- and CUL4-associated factor 4 n=1 Tax=Patella vulgata TaxID=6465 RepID=UPI0024A94F8B|nr:DDB1- and CUL4-associated factor 4 [Patella vulgata]